MKRGLTRAQLMKKLQGLQSMTPGMRWGAFLDLAVGKWCLTAREASSAEVLLEVPDLPPVALARYIDAVADGYRLARREDPAQKGKPNPSPSQR